MRFAHIRGALTLVRPLGLAAAIFAGFMLAGHAYGVVPLYRPLSGGPATHPLTALAMMLLGAGLCFWRPRRSSPLTQLLATGALLIGLLRLADLSLGTDLLASVTPIADSLEAQQLAGQPVAMGANTAAMTAILATALVLDSRRNFLAAQFCAFVGLGFPLVAVTGYAYGLDKFHGQMALSTVIAALVAGSGTLVASAQRGVLRAVLSPWVGGRIARTQILLGYVVPFVIGYILIAIAAHNPKELFGLFVVLVSAFISGLIAFSAVFQEGVDKDRRGAERRLAIAATLDPLTELPNRRLLMQAAERELDRAQRHGLPLSVLMVDIDHFKRLNDRHGHLAGDAVLRHVADLMRGTLRKEDLLARYGGEEFVVLLPDTPLAGAAQLAEKLRRRIEATAWDEIAAVQGTVTVSIGCTDNQERNQFAALLNAADAALYLAKAGGRNRVVLGTGNGTDLLDLAPAM
jgi:diguanylate cyclase (GGDEF)-like protein